MRADSGRTIPKTFPTATALLSGRAIYLPFRKRPGQAASYSRRCLAIALLAAAYASGCESTDEEKELAISKSRAFAEVRIFRKRLKVLNDHSEPESREDFEVYRGTQMRMVKSQFVLNAVLRDPEISKSSIMRDQADKIAFLEENLEVTVPATEFLRISFKGARTPESVKLVNAVVDEYLREVVNFETTARTRQISELEKVHRDLDEQLRIRKNTLKRLVKNLQSGDSTPRTEKEKMMAELNAALHKERVRIYLELLNARARLAILERSRVEDETQNLAPATTDPAKSPAESRVASEARASELKDSIRLSEMLIRQIDDELDKQTPAIVSPGNWSLEVEALKEDLLLAQKIDRQIVEEIERLKIELRADTRVVRYRDATIVDEK